MSDVLQSERSCGIVMVAKKEARGTSRPVSGIEAVQRHRGRNNDDQQRTPHATPLSGHHAQRRTTSPAAPANIRSFLSPVHNGAYVPFFRKMKRLMLPASILLSFWRYSPPRIADARPAAAADSVIFTQSLCHDMQHAAMSQRKICRQRAMVTLLMSI